MSARHEATRAGIGFGSALAITISWSANKSLLLGDRARAAFLAVRDLLRDSILDGRTD